MKSAIRIFSQVYSIVLLGLISFEVWEDGKATFSNVFLGLSALLLLASFLAMFIGVLLKNRSLLIVAALASCPTLLEGIYRALRGLPTAEENIFLILITWPVLFFGYRAIQEGSLLPSQESIQTNLSKRLLPVIAVLTSPFIILGVISFSGIYQRPSSCLSPMECLAAAENTTKWWNISGDSYVPAMEKMCEQGVPRACLHFPYFPSKVKNVKQRQSEVFEGRDKWSSYKGKHDAALAEVNRLKSDASGTKGSEERLASLLEESYNPAARIRLLKFLALEAKDTIAILELAIVYANGSSQMKIEKDIHVSEKLFKEAIRNGSHYAVERLGNLYSMGGAPGFNFTQALRQWREACRMGIASACRNIGNQFLGDSNGLGGNSVEALYWFTLGARRKDCASALRVLQVLPKSEKGNNIGELSFLMLAGEKDGEACRSRITRLQANMSKMEIEAAKVASRRLAEERVIRDSL